MKGRVKKQAHRAVYGPWLPLKDIEREYLKMVYEEHAEHARQHEQPDG